MWIFAVLAATLSPPPPSAPWSGEVVKVDLAHRRLVVRTQQPRRETAVAVDPVRTHLLSGGRRIPLEAVRPGDWARLIHEPASPRPLALLVRIGGGKAAP